MTILPPGYIPANDHYTGSPYTDPKVYIYGIRCGEHIKVGIAKNISKRLDSFRLGNPYPIEVVFKRPAYLAFCKQIERAMHEYLKEYAVGREWFRCTVEDVKAASRYASIDYYEVKRNMAKAHTKWVNSRAYQRDLERLAGENNAL